MVTQGVWVTGRSPKLFQDPGIRLLFALGADNTCVAYGKPLSCTSLIMQIPGCILYTDKFVLKILFISILTILGSILAMPLFSVFFLIGYGKG